MTRTEEHSSTPHIGRTHGRFAVPITFGFALALHLDRLVGRIEAIRDTRLELHGQMSGAVGASNAFSLLRPDEPLALNDLVVRKLGLKNGLASQIVQPEYMADLAYAMTSCFGVLANIADDCRHLHRSEIGEIEEGKGEDEIGSSAMPHKVNPIRFENVKSLWKAFMPRIVTVLMDYISEHQRDLTNSASNRFALETFAALDYGAVELKEVLEGIHIDVDRMKANVDASFQESISEAISIILLSEGVQDGLKSFARLQENSMQGGP